MTRESRLKRITKSLRQVAVVQGPKDPTWGDLYRLCQEAADLIDYLDERIEELHEEVEADHG